ncbi:MAG: hypothetical protein OEV57_05580 [Dehalococcoidia bacterium]|nr:hypothetical protein [Dehalococcoidia bacterium]MDH4367584.1 hypothetical protein [Dehalococcoidia bacterium]
MNKICSMLLALVLVVSLGLVTAVPALASTIRYVPSVYPTIQAAINASSDGDTIMVAAGNYSAFVLEAKSNISIISAEGVTVTTANCFTVDIGPIVGDVWVMAAVNASENINIEGINFDGTQLSGEENVCGIAYVDSTGSVADLTVKNIIGTGWDLGGVAIIGDTGTSVVDLPGVTVHNSLAGIAIFNSEANLDGCTITDTGIGILIGWPLDGFGPSTAEVKGSTIGNATVGIWVCDDSTLEGHFNNIVGNAESGLYNAGSETVDAVYNWWGDASGPYHPTTNPLGTGNAVSNNVSFMPWLGDEVVTETVEDGFVDAKAEADTEVWVTGRAKVTVSTSTSNPVGDPPPGATSLGRYIDVYVSDPAEVEEIEIRHYYTDDDVGNMSKTLQEYLRLRWWNGAEWRPYSDSGVNTSSIGDYAGYIWGKVRADTEPRLIDLTGTWNDDFWEGPSDIPCGCFIATAAYGTDTAKQLDILREFRDTILLPNSLGAKLVSFYYKTSPAIANFISQREILRTVVRTGFVDPIVKMLKWTHDLWSA